MLGYRLFVCVTTFSLVALSQEAGSDSKQRIKAARDLAKQGAGAIPSLTAMLSDADSAVRLEAVKSLTEVAT